METHASPSHVIIAYDATKDRSEHELEITVDGVRLRGDILRGGDKLVVLGVLHRVPNPLGYQTKPCPDSFVGTSSRAMEEEVSKKVDAYTNMLLHSAEVCDNEGVSIEVKITAGTPMKKVILQEVVSCNATWIILDRHLRRDLKFYLKQIPCKVAIIQDSLSVDVYKSQSTNATDVIENKIFYSMMKPVPLLNSQANESIEQSVTSPEKSDILKDFMSSSGNTLKELEKLGSYNKGENISTALNEVQKQYKNAVRQRSSEAPLLCTGCGTRTELYYMKDSIKFSFSDIQRATENFSNENLLGEGGFGHVYKGELQDGQLIAAKVRKEASTQGFTEFHSEVYVLSFARHKNIVMLLGYCCKENLNILVYEYICNKSLDWHLFDEGATVLEWHRRYLIAIGTAKGLRFLHEECRGGPIIHRDMRPSNILITHDFIPMLGDFGLARWKANDDSVQTRVLGTLGYVAPEYAENGIVSVRTDVYAFGIVLLQLISGRRVVDAKREQQSLRQWATPLIEKLALHELIDPRIEESYDTYELYIMAKTAHLCVQTNPEMRPSMGKVVRLLEGENEQYHRFEKQSVPHYTK